MKNLKNTDPVSTHSLHHPRPCVVAAAIAMTLGASAAVRAQAPAAAGEPGARTLAPVTVTVNRGVALSTFDTPASIDVIEGSVLQSGQLQVNLSESLVRVPGLVVQNRQNYAQDLQLSLRGFGARSTFGVRGLRLYADGIPATGPDGQGQVSHFDLASAERVEVLRGPFSALYGNSSGGVISIFTADGGPETVADINTAWGSDGVQRIGLKLSGQSGKLQYNIGAARFRTDGYREHSAAQRDSFNGKFTFNQSADTRITLVLNSLRMPDVQDPLGLTRAEFEADPRQATAVATLFNTRKSVEQSQAGLILNHRLSSTQSLQVTAYGGERETVQFQAIPAATQAAPTQPGGVIDLERRYRGLDARWIARTRLADRPLTVTAGLAVDEARDERRGFQNFVGNTLGVTGALRRNEANRARSFDQYLQGEWALAERWSASAGVRHSQVRFDSRDRYITPGNPDDSGSVRYGATTPALGLVFHASEHLNFYGSVGRGFETPTLNEAAYRPSGATGLNFDLQSARSLQWELGLKARPAPGWQAQVAVFRASTKDEIAVLSNTGGRSVFQNAGRTRRDGLEASLAGAWGVGWSTLVAASWIDARYRQDFLTCVAAPCARPTTPVAAGNRIPGIPRASLFAELGWKHRPWGLATGLELRHIGSIAVDDRNTDHAPAATTLALRASLTQKVGGWTFNEFVRIDNLTGRQYAGSVIVNEGNRRFFEPAPGRTWLVGFNASHAF